MRIGIELNHVLRDINKQIVKYYQKDVDPMFDDETVDLRDTEHFLENFSFEGKKALNKFLYIDYPYEIFGCARTMEDHLAVKFTTWLKDTEDNDEFDIDVCLFSRNEEALTIQSTFFFLSKIGCRAREMRFPTTDDDIYKSYDAFITEDVKLAENAPESVAVTLITNGRDVKCKKKDILIYEHLSDVFEDKEFFKKLSRI